MNEQKTGYPHLDKPWMKYYENLDYNYQAPHTNIADYIKTRSQNRKDLVAETYYTRKFTYGELFQRIDDASRVLAGLGVSKGDTIFNLVPNIPESGQIWLGASQIGAISDFADPRPDSLDLQANANKILELLRYEKADYIVALDKCYSYMLKPIENEIKELGVNNIVIVSANDSMNIRGIIDYLRDVIKYNALRNKRLADEAVGKLKFYEALYAKVKSLSDDRKSFEEATKSSPVEVIRYKDLVKDCQNVQYEEIKDENLVSYIGHTSGTSGAKPKPIPLTNKNQIFASEQLIKSGLKLSEGDRVIHELPFFSPLGSNNNYIVDLAAGTNLIDVPEFEINEFGYLIKKYKPNVFLGTPSWLSSLLNCEYLKSTDLSSVKMAIFGGDAMTKKEQMKLDGWLKEHKSKAVVENGHGMSEYCGCGSYAQNEWNEYESIGIPLPDVIYGVVDPNVDDKLVPVKEVDNDGYVCGELVVSSDAVTNGMLNGDVIVKHYEMDGRDYIRTRDLVKMRSDGVFFFESRKDRGFTRFDGYKVKPYEIEREIEKFDGVKQCRIVPYFDKEKNGFMPMAHIVLNMDKNASFDDEAYIDYVYQIILERFINNPETSSRQVPTKFKFREAMPVSKNGKVFDKILLDEELDGSEINVNIEETNLSVGNIEVYKNNKTKKLTLN